MFCGGLGTRIRDYSKNIPKPMIQVGELLALDGHVKRQTGSFSRVGQLPLGGVAESPDKAGLSWRAPRQRSGSMLRKAVLTATSKRASRWLRPAKTQVLRISFLNRRPWWSYSRSRPTRRPRASTLSLGLILLLSAWEPSLLWASSRGYQPIALTRSPKAIQSSYDGQVIENLDLYVDSGDAIMVTHDNVITRNVRIHHAEGSGIVVSGASNVTIENCEIINSDPPAGNQPESKADIINIKVYGSPNLTVDHVTVRDGSSGIYLVESPRAKISNVEGYNFHGPFPRGQFVQFDKSHDSTLTSFYTLSDGAQSYTEDNVSIYHSKNVKISNGLIDGNNSPSGVGIMFEGNSEGGSADHVDAIRMGNGAFSSYSKDVTFDFTRSFDNIASDQGRGKPMSNALIWNVSASGISILHSSYTHPAKRNNIVWGASKAVALDVHEDRNATPMDRPVHNHFDWS